VVSDQLLFVLKIALLVLLYLFFFRVVRAVWAELRPAGHRAQPAAPLPAHSAVRRPRRDQPKVVKPQLVVLEPVELFGSVFQLETEASIGRAAGCQITLDDTYASQIHARLFTRDSTWQVEDLGSTNGTWLNRQKVSGPMVISPGDRLQIGNTILEMQ
jgi:pSer/pThr/pTyr-binding forkhead associated (FHA) protein